MARRRFEKGIGFRFFCALWTIFPIPKDDGNASDPTFPYCDSNNVWIRLKDGSEQRVGMDTSLHPWRNQFAPGPW